MKNHPRKALKLLKRDAIAIFNVKSISVILSNIFTAAVSYVLSFAIRFDFSIPENVIQMFWDTLPLAILIFTGVFFIFGLFKSVYKYASLNDMTRIVYGVSASVILLYVFQMLFFHIHGFPKSVLVIYFMVMLLLVGTLNMSGRIIHNVRRSIFGIKDANRLLIVGAGEAGYMILCDIMGMAVSEYIPIGFIDDNEKKIGKTINGIPILGTIQEMPKIVADYRIDDVFITIPSAGSELMRRIINICRNLKVRISTIPRLDDIIHGKTFLRDVRKIELLDLLKREPVHVDTQKMEEFIRGKVVMITGAGGSIGSELCKQTAKLGPKLLVLYDISECNLYNIENDLISDYPALKTVSILADIADKGRIEKVLLEHKPGIIFHAAAHKHVPMGERNPLETIFTNLIGTITIEDAAAKYGVEKFILISTDKAVNPIGVMGASKRAAELITQIFNTKSRTSFSVVRFGNVLGSSGSIVPFFEKQILRGGPITVSDPNVSRYFMTSSEAGRLILQAVTISAGGEIFVLDMGNPVKILNLAKDMITLSGLEPEKDIKIKITCLRPGDKLAEELFSANEKPELTSHEKIIMIKPASADIEKIEKNLELIRFAIHQKREREAVHLLKEIVPEYTISQMWR